MTDKQSKVYDLYKNQNLSFKEIGLRLKISKISAWRLYQKYVKNQKKTSVKIKVAQTCEGGMEGGGVTLPPVQSGKIGRNQPFVRIHGKHFVVTPYHFGKFYESVKKKANIILDMHGWRVELNKKNMEVIMRRGSSFIGKDRFEADERAYESFNYVLKRIENRLKVGILKTDYMNIRLCREHIAVVKDGVATKIKSDTVLYNKDGEAWFIYDQSNGVPEWEVVHPETVKMDYDTMEFYFNDFQTNRPPNNSQLSMRLMDTIKGLDYSNKTITGQVELLLRRIEKIEGMLGN